MNLFSLRALWRGLRGRSLVFSLVFAMALMGFSLAGFLRSPMRAIGLWGPLIFILPILLIGKTSKLEGRLGIRPEVRQACCLVLIYGSIVLAAGIWLYGLSLEQAYQEKAIRPGPKFVEDIGPDLPRGPRNRR